MKSIKLLLKIGGWVFVSIAIIDLTITFFVYRHSQTFVQTASQAQATITKMVERKRGQPIVWIEMRTGPTQTMG